jgi:hypothetical protein
MPYLDVGTLDFEKINVLANNNTPEDQFLEYKREIGSNKEVAKDVCSFANGSGGLIIYGVEEQEPGVPRIVGIDPQDSVEQIDNVVASALSPRVKVITRLIPIPNSERALLVVSVPESDLKPHMVSSYEDRRYYVRRNATNIKMDEIEIQDAYQRRKKAQDDADKLALKVIQGRYSLKYKDESWASFICIPRQTNDELIPIDRETQQFLSLFHTNYQGRGLFNGYPEVGPEGFTIIRENQGEPLNKYAFVGREGYVEFTQMMGSTEYFPSLTVAQQALKFLDFCGQLYERVGYFGMVKIFLGIDHVGSLMLGLDQRRFWVETPKFKTGEIHVYREESVSALRAERERIGKAFMDRVYQAAGLMECDYFDSDGKFAPR